MKKIAPWFISAVVWTSLIFYLLFVDLVVIPQTTRDVDVFPYNASIEIANQANTTEHLSVATTAPTSSSTDPTTTELDATDTKLKEEEPKPKKAAAERPFFETFVGVPGGRKNVYLASVGVALIGIAMIVSATCYHFVGGLVSIAVSFGISSIILTKILFWFPDPWTRSLFLATRIFEYSILISVGSRLCTFHTDYLGALGAVFSNFAALLFAGAFMASDESLVQSTSLLLPMWIMLLAIPIFPLLRRSLGPREAAQQKIALFVAAVVPFCLATLFNWWFHISWMGDIAMPKISYRNTLVIYLVGLVFGSVVLFLKHVLPLLQNARFSWNLVIVILGIITHIALFNHIFAKFVLPDSLFQFIA